MSYSGRAVNYLVTAANYSLMTELLFRQLFVNGSKLLGNFMNYLVTANHQVMSANYSEMSEQFRNLSKLFKNICKTIRKKSVNHSEEVCELFGKLTRTIWKKSANNS